MIVVCAGMSRSGSTLQYQIIRELVERTGLGEGKGSWNYNKPRPESSEIFVYKSERFIGESVSEVDHAFAIIRNPLDVVVSLYRYRLANEYYKCTGVPIPLEDIIYDEMVLVMLWIDQWEKAGANLIRYEDLYPDGWHKIAEQAASILDITLPQADAMNIAKKFSKEENAMRITNQKKWFDYTDSMLTLGHIGPHGGEPGQGEEHLTSDQIGYVERYAGDFMRRHGYL